MSAEAIASVVIERLASVALNQLEEHFQLVMGAEGEVEKLTDSYKAIQALLYDAEIKKITNNNVNFWLQRFRDVAYEMDDILDQWVTTTLMSQIGNHTNGASSSSSSGNNKSISKNNKMVYSYFSSFCSCFGKLAQRHETGLKIKDLREKLDVIVSEKDALSLISSLSAANEHPAGERLPSSSIVDETQIFGRADEQNIILSKLLVGTTSPFIVSIVGMGGLGKTTLAQLVCKEGSMKSYVENNVIWVSVSDYFDQTRIAKEIIRGAGVRVPDYLSEWNDELHNLLCESVKKNRFLLVLDDMWTEDENKWEPFRLAFRNAAPGSRILVTTRSRSVAEMIDSSYIHTLEILSEDNCWFLLSRLAFHGKNADKEGDKTWREIGTKIAERCKGVPLSAKVLGNLLRQKQDIIEWRRVMENEFIWELEKAENGILKPALLLSYYDLPPPVRACFVYCAIFPKGHQIHKDQLISMWMAQGLIVSRGSGGEAAGKEYFNRLAARSFFQNFVKDSDGNIIHCDMHDLVHDFAKFLTKGEYLTLADTSSDPVQSLKPRHLTLFCENSFNPDSLPSISDKEKHLRTFLVLNRSYQHLQLKAIIPGLLRHLKYLRVLIIKNSDLECLPKEIEKLIHLRYLNLYGNSFLTELPDSLCSLYNLQTLDVSHCSRLRKLPEELGRMLNLRRLLFEGTVSMKYLPQGIGKLISLRALTNFIVGVVGGCDVKQLKDLNQLEGDLTISGLGRVQSSQDASEVMLKEKQNLHSLLLDFEFEEDRGLMGQFMDTPGFIMPTYELLGKVPEMEMHHVLAALEPPPMLQKLRIVNYEGSKFSSWIASSEMLANLHKLELDHCNCVGLPALGNLPSLEHLNILHMHELKNIGPEFYGVDGGGQGNTVAFPRLKTLRISEAHGLEDWDDFTMLRSGRAVAIMPLLHEVELRNCIKLKALPALGTLPSLEHLNISGLHNVKHIGTEFYGDGGGYADSVAFPKLKTFRIEGVQNLETWDTSATQGMPCLRELELCGCKCLKVLPAFGRLPSLQHLNIDGLHSLKHIGHEFYGDVGGHSVRVAFPKLEKLRIEGAHMLEEWDAFPTVGGAGPGGFDVMPCLGELELNNCGLKALPALGKLQLLRQLEIRGLGNLGSIGSEFYGAGGSDHANRVAFPRLENLRISRADSLEEWNLSAEECSDRIPIMPCLREVYISSCGALKKLPALGKLPSLEILDIRDMNSLKEIGNEFHGIGGGNNFVSFPSLLTLYMGFKLELWWGFGTDAVNVIMPCVRHIHFEGLELITLPALGNLASLETLTLSRLENVACIGPEFYGSTVADVTATVSVFPRLCQLRLLHMQNLQWWEPGTVTESPMSLMPCLRDLEIRFCFILPSLPQHLSNTLMSLSWEMSALRTPPALGKLEALEELDIFTCGWGYMPTEIQGMRRLRTLSVGASKSLEENCTGVGWSIISHIPDIRIGSQTFCGHC